jgi:Ca2+-dependent lipid-binding protein
MPYALSLGFPDPFAVATVNGEQTRTTSVIKKTLNPYWNESFDLYAAWSPRRLPPTVD